MSKIKRTQILLFFAQLFIVGPNVSMEPPEGHQKRPCKKFVNGACPSHPLSKLHKAICAGEIHEVRDLVDSGVPLDVPYKGHRPLHLAVQEGQKQIVEFLLAAGARVNEDVSSETALHRAARCGKIEMIELLLCHGANINAERSDGMTPLDLAIKNGHEKIVKLLIDVKKERKEELEWQRWLSIAEKNKQKTIFQWMKRMRGESAPTQEKVSNSKTHDSEYVNFDLPKLKWSMINTPPQANVLSASNKRSRTQTPAAASHEVEHHTPEIEQQTREFNYFQNNLGAFVQSAYIQALNRACELKVDTNSVSDDGRCLLEMAAFHEDETSAAEMVEILVRHVRNPNPTTISGQSLIELLNQHGRAAIAALIAGEIKLRHDVHKS